MRFHHPKSQKFILRATELNNKNTYVLQAGAALFYYNLMQTLLQIGVASLLQIKTNIIRK